MIQAAERVRAVHLGYEDNPAPILCKLVCEDPRSWKKVCRDEHKHAHE